MKNHPNSLIIALLRSDYKLEFQESTTTKNLYHCDVWL